MKKNTVKKIAGIATAATMAVSAATATTVTAFASGPDNNRTTIAIDLNNIYGWGDFGAEMEAYFFNTVNCASKEVGLSEDNGTFSTKVPTGYNKVVFMRKSPNGEIWNQTYDLDIEHNKTYVVTGFEGRYYVGYWQ